MGHEVEYEVDLEGLTPDWLVSSAGRGPQFVVEVVSSKPPVQRERYDDGWDELRRRVEGVVGNTVLYIQPPFPVEDEEPVAPPSAQRQKQIVRRVREWLDTAPLEGTTVSIDEIVIHLMERDRNLTHVSCGIGYMPFCVDAAPLKESVKEKAKTYRKVVQARRLPFVVCIVPDFDSGRGLDDLESAVLGEERCHLVKLPHGRLRQKYYRDNDGLFVKYPTLSAVTLGKWNRDKLVHTVLLNTLATNPLDERAFPPATSKPEGP
jgi:hypothetical protein